MGATLESSPNTATALETGRPTRVDFKANLIVVIIPAYNEEHFIGSVVLKILQYPVMVIVVDDGSTDGTAAIARAAGATVFQHKKNLGKGEALNTGFCEARTLQPAAIVIIDGDGQHLPEQLVELVHPVLQGEADLVVGSRYLQKGCHVPRHRLLGHRFFNVLTSAASGVRVTDSQSGYRAFSPKAYNTELFHCTNFTVESEMQFLAHEHHLRVKEVPITVRYIEKPKRPVWQQGLVVLGGILRLAGQYRPLLFFAMPGVLLALTGIGMGFWVVERFLEVRQIAIGTAFGSLVFLMTGLILFSTGIILYSVRGLLSETLHAHFRSEQHA